MGGWKSRRVEGWKGGSAEGVQGHRGKRIEKRQQHQPHLKLARRSQILSVEGQLRLCASVPLEHHNHLGEIIRQRLPVDPQQHIPRL